MNSTGNDPLPRTLAWMQTGDPNALGLALEACRQYLLMVADTSLPSDLRAKGGASDLVQDTLLDAHQHLGSFHGNTREELIAWLTEILRCRIANFQRGFRHTAKRQVSREVSLDGGNRAGYTVEPAAKDDTPSAIVSKEEDAQQLKQAIARLPEDYRRVLVLRYKEHRSFDDIAGLMNRSFEATRKLWQRAVTQLKHELQSP